MAEKIFVSADWDDDKEIAFGKAKNINSLFNTGDRHLTSVKIYINLQYETADINVGYEDVSRLRETGPEDTMPDLCEALIRWPYEDADPTWIDYIFPKRQMMRALLLSRELKVPLIVKSSNSSLKCYMENGEAHIEKI